METPHHSTKTPSVDDVVPPSSPNDDDDADDDEDADEDPDNPYDEVPDDDRARVSSVHAPPAAAEWTDRLRLANGGKKNGGRIVLRATTSTTTTAADGVDDGRRRGGSLSPSSSSSSSYYTSRPRPSSFLPEKLSLSQRLREYRHSNGIMTTMSTIVLLTLLLSSLVSMLLAFPQFALGLILGPILKNRFWLVEFLYRYNVARWGHLKIIALALRRGKASSAAGGADYEASKKIGGSREGSRHAAAAATTTTGGGGVEERTDGHSRTLHRRIVVVPDRVYVHPIPNFLDNVAYLIVCTPEMKRSSLPVIALLVDCGESDRILRHMERIYERYYMRDHPRSAASRGKRTNDDGIICEGNDDGTTSGMELYGILCTHHHHDHTAGIGPLMAELTTRRTKRMGGGGVIVTSGCGGGSGGRDGENRGNSRSERPPSDVYESAPGNIVVVGGAAENVPHCNLFVKNGCFVPLPCVTVVDARGQCRRVNDMNAVVSIEVIGAPGHTRGSVVYALRNRPAPCVDVPIDDVDGSSPSRGSSLSSSAASTPPPLQSHLFTGDVIFCGGCGVPFEADLEYPRDDHVKNPTALKRKHGSSALRPGAGAMSMERCFVEVLTRAAGPSSGGEERRKYPSSSELPPRASKFLAAFESPRTAPSEAAAPTAAAGGTITKTTTTTLLYPGHEYTTDLLMRQFDLKTINAEIHWSKFSPSTFFEVASHYLVSAHRRGLPPDQRILTIPTPLERELIVNPNFRMLKRRGERLVDALMLWYEFGAKTIIPDGEDVVAGETNIRYGTVSEKQKQLYPTVFTTVYTSDLQNVVNNLRSGTLGASLAADQLESMHTKLDEKLIGRRPIPSTLPSHKNVYLAVVAMAMLGSSPSAVTVSDAIIMNLAPPVDSSDSILISKSRLIAALEGLGLLSSKDYPSPRLEDIIHLLWREAQLDYDVLKLEIEHPDGRDVECSIKYEDDIELGLLKLALFGVAFNQPTTKMCVPCFDEGPRYDGTSWVEGKLRRTNAELVRHDAKSCFACQQECGVSFPRSTEVCTYNGVK